MLHSKSLKLVWKTLSRAEAAGWKPGPSPPEKSRCSLWSVSYWHQQLQPSFTPTNQKKWKKMQQRVLTHMCNSLSLRGEKWPFDTFRQCDSFRKLEARSCVQYSRYFAITTMWYYYYPLKHALQSGGGLKTDKKANKVNSWKIFRLSMFSFRPCHSRVAAKRLTRLVPKSVKQDFAKENWTIITAMEQTKWLMNV